MDTDTEVQTNLKIPKSLKEKLKVAAKENHRSMTAELVARLQDSFEPKQQTLDAETRSELLSALLAELAEERLLQMMEERTGSNEKG